MFLRGIWLLIKLALLGFVAILLSQMGGNLRFDMGNWRVEMPASIALLLILFGLYLLIKLTRLKDFLYGIPATLRRKRDAKRQENGMRALTYGLISASAGDALTTRKQAELASNLIGEQAATLLLKAQASLLHGDYAAAEADFKKLQEKEESQLAGSVGLLRLAEAKIAQNPLNAKEAKQEALQLAQTICKTEPYHPIAAPLLKEMA